MTGSQLRPDWAASALADCEAVLFGQGVHRWVVGLSGGVDSTVLLHWLSHLSNRLPILALHVDHQLDPEVIIMRKNKRTEEANKTRRLVKDDGE